MPGIRDSMTDLHALDQPEMVLPRTVSDNSIYGIDISREDEKVVIDALARHVIYSKCQCSISHCKYG